VDKELQALDSAVLLFSAVHKRLLRCEERIAEDSNTLDELLTVSVERKDNDV